MPEEVIPQKVQLVVKRGFERMQRYKKATTMFTKEFVGQYYRDAKGMRGEEPINLIFATIRSWVPNLVMQNPVNVLSTEIKDQRAYGELLGLSIDRVEKEIKLKKTLRAWIVSALFGLGIIKTSIAASGVSLQFGDINIDPGQVYAELVSLDNFVIDPVCTDLSKSSFYGDRITVPRQMLLDTDGYDHDLVRKLPTSKTPDAYQKESLTKQSTSVSEFNTLQDNVDVVELWVPEANSLITIPDPRQTTFDKYIRLIDYYGPDDGPYTYLSFTPPVQDNPLPISPVSIWYDLHKMANRVFTRTMEQSDRNKSVMLFNPAQADEAQDIADARDGDTIACVDPKGIQVVNFGGQNPKDELYLKELQTWYNYMAGNPDQMAGNLGGGGAGKETATRSQILQSNANISIEDARDILYDATADVSRKIGWHLHTDPLIDMPVTKRRTGSDQVQLRLTPEQRQGDFLTFTFSVKQRSMSRLDPTIRAKRIVEFGTSLVPAIFNSAMISMQMGQPFNVQRAITDMSEALEIHEEVMDWFDDPMFDQKMAMMSAMGPQDKGKAEGGGTGSASNGAIAQNRGMMAPPVMDQNQMNNQNAQMTAAESQSSRMGL